MARWCLSILLVVSFCAGNGSGVATTVSAPPTQRGADKPLAAVETWFYMLDVDLEEDLLTEIADSSYHMVVIDFIPSEANNTDYPMAETVDRLHRAPVPKIVLAYIDIGQAEDYRTYWEPAWRPGEPEWIAGEDPDGWEGNFPVAFWYDGWRAIWLDEGGYLEAIVESGFDGVYLDWVEAYSDPNVIAIAERDGADPVQEMVWWVQDISEEGRSMSPGFVVVAQNAAELVEIDEYAETIDALAQEQVWFDGGADNDPPGDCPLPRTEADVESDAYVASLTDECLRQYLEFPESTLHVSSEEYLGQLAVATAKGLPVFTVDYALDPDNVAWVLAESRSHGFVPFVGSRALDGFVPVE